MRYHTWDALVVGKSTLRLPDHLAATFGRQTITTPEFAAAWPQVVAEQRALCNHVSTLRKPLDLLAFLAARDPLTPWEERRAAYSEAMRALRALRDQAAEVQAQVQALYARLK